MSFLSLSSMFVHDIQKQVYFPKYGRSYKRCSASLIINIWVGSGSSLSWKRTAPIWLRWCSLVCVIEWRSDTPLTTILKSNKYWVISFIKIEAIYLGTYQGHTKDTRCFINSYVQILHDWVVSVCVCFNVIFCTTVENLVKNCFAKFLLKG